MESLESQPNKRRTSHQIENKITSASLTKVTVVKIPRNNTSKSRQNQSNEDLKISDNDVNFTSDIDISNDTNDNTKLNQNTAIDINDESCPNPENSNTLRRRASSLSAVIVTKVKKNTTETKVTLDHPKTDMNANSGNKSATPKVTRISKKKKRSATQPFQSDA